MFSAVEQKELDQFGSQYPEELWKPEVEEGCYFEQIYREQNRMLAARQAKAKAAKAAGEKTAAVGERRPSVGSAGFGGRSDEPAAKRSKWGNANDASSGNAFADFNRFQK